MRLLVRRFLTAPVLQLVCSGVQSFTMFRSLRLRLIGAFIALFGMLFMQLAVAGYFCPNFSPGVDDSAMTLSASVDMQDMPGCDHSLPVQASLCHAQAHANQVSLDKPALPDVQPFIPGTLALIIESIDPAYRAATHPLYRKLALAHPTAPPLTIRNCCFRI
jgi:hypothetical protein